MRLRSLLLLGVLLGLTACSHLRIRQYDQAQYPPSDKIEVFHSAPQGRPYTEIARLSIRKNAWRDGEARLIEEAKKLGAEGIVFLAPDNRGILSDAVAIAIRWK